MSEISLKTCIDCDKTLPLDSFWCDKTHSDGHQSNCISCARKKNKEYWATEHGKRTHHKASIRRKYGMDINDWDAMFVKQNGICAICGNPESRTYKGNPVRLAVDHDHKTGEIRQLLCYRCNSVIGFVDDDIDLLRKIESYLELYCELN